MNGVAKKRVLSLRPEYMATDPDEYGAAAAEVELEWPAPRSVVVRQGGRDVQVQAHSQILRIRAEDSHLGEDIFGVVDFMLFSRRILPASPLSTKPIQINPGA